MYRIQPDEVNQHMKTTICQLINSVLKLRLLTIVALSFGGLVSLPVLAQPSRAVIKTVAVGEHPTGLAFDGANVWIANSRGGTVTKVRASDGVVLDTFPAGDAPYQLTFDGTNIWVLSFADANLLKLRTSDGAILGLRSGSWTSICPFLMAITFGQPILMTKHSVSGVPAMASS